MFQVQVETCVEAGLLSVAHEQTQKRPAEEIWLRAKALAYIVNMRPHLAFYELHIVMISDAAQG
jgi:hypothetical protein